MRDPDRVVPIFYSLGNLALPFSVRYMCRSGGARIELAKGTTTAGSPRTYVRMATLDHVEQVVDPRERTISLRRT